MAESWDGAETIFSFKVRSKSIRELLKQVVAESNDESGFGVWNCSVTSATVQMTSNPQIQG
jgi:hypothetical protein